MSTKTALDPAVFLKTDSVMSIISMFHEKKKNFNCKTARYLILLQIFHRHIALYIAKHGVE
jgi:hypothetical protein